MTTTTAARASRSTPLETQAASAFPVCDAAVQSEISDAQAQFFRDQGLLVIRNLLRGQELADLQAQTHTA